MNVASSQTAPPLFLARPCFCCLFTFWQPPTLFCYFQLSHFISAYTFLWKWCLGFRGCLLVVIHPLSSHSLLQLSFAMPFHPVPSYCLAPFELFKSGLLYCSIPFKTSTKPCLWFAGLVKRRRGYNDWEGGTLVTVTGFLCSCWTKLLLINVPM